MDESLRDLQRQLESDPKNEALRRRYQQARLRAGLPVHATRVNGQAKIFRGPNIETASKEGSQLYSQIVEAKSGDRDLLVEQTHVIDFRLSLPKIVPHHLFRELEKYFGEELHYGDLVDMSDHLGSKLGIVDELLDEQGELSLVLRRLPWPDENRTPPNMVYPTRIPKLGYWGGCGRILTLLGLDTRYYQQHTGELIELCDEITFTPELEQLLAEGHSSKRLYLDRDNGEIVVLEEGLNDAG